MSDRLLNAQNSVLLVVDIQEKFLGVVHHSELLIEKTRILLQAAQELSIPVVISEQYPQGLGHTADALKDVISESATILEKSAFGCGADEGIRNHLAQLGRKQVVVCGLEAHVCVNQTVHQLLAAGYQVHVVQDAITARSKKDLKLGLAKMTQSGAIPSGVEMALFEWLGHSRHEAFKRVQALIK